MDAGLHKKKTFDRVFSEIQQNSNRQWIIAEIDTIKGQTVKHFELLKEIRSRRSTKTLKFRSKKTKNLNRYRFIKCFDTWVVCMPLGVTFRNHANDLIYLEQSQIIFHVIESSSNAPEKGSHFKCSGLSATQEHMEKHSIWTVTVELV